MSVVSWAVCGLGAGIIARFWVPQPRPMSLVKAVTIGVTGSLVGGYVYWQAFVPTGDFSRAAGEDWSDLIVASLTAMLALWLYPHVHRTRRQW